ncbi:MAG: hypothetical protein JEY99_13555 [Spirochaetales bacterium]|nr:hypothetical protein [Spirochaetales bacterium]
MNEWYHQAGVDSDVVLSTRGRISRNLSGHLYPGSMGIEEENSVKEKVRDAFSQAGEGYTYLALEEMPPMEKRLLLEQKLITQDFCLNKDKHLILGDDRNFSGMINGEDHLRMVSFSGGLALEDVLGKLMDIDSKLEEIIDFNATFDLGYIGPDLKNLGTALKMSVMLHLPSLEATGLIDKALKTILHAGMEITGFSGEKEQSLGQFYIISNRNTLGDNENGIREKLSDITGQLLTYERMAREDLVKRKMIELEDRVFRGEGLLANCRLLSRNEGIELSAALRLGTVLELNNYSLEKLNGLLVLGQDSHIKERLKSRNEDIDSISVDRERAEFFRNYLYIKDTQGGSA